MSPIKILIVEDEAIIALEIKIRLLSMGYDVTGIVSTGEDAISLAASTIPNLILMDIKLKGKIDGIEAALIIKEKFSIPSIFITAFSDGNTIKIIKDDLHFELLLKPLKKEDLKLAIEKTLNNHN